MVMRHWSSCRTFGRSRGTAHGLRTASRDCNVAGGGAVGPVHGSRSPADAGLLTDNAMKHLFPATRTNARKITP